MNVHFSSKNDEWETPPELFARYDAIYHFNIDVCATSQNTMVPAYWTKQQDSLTQLWAPLTCWMNPPYGRQVGRFVSKAYKESLLGATVVCLLPSRTDTAWWHDYVMKGRITFLRGRLKFRLDGEIRHPAPFPSAIVIFRPSEQD